MKNPSDGSGVAYNIHAGRKSKQAVPKPFHRRFPLPATGIPRKSSISWLSGGSVPGIVQPSIHNRGPLAVCHNDAHANRGAILSYEFRFEKLMGQNIFAGGKLHKARNDPSEPEHDISHGAAFLPLQP